MKNKNKNSTQRVEDSRSILDALRRIVQVTQRSSKTVETQFRVSGAQLFVLHKVSESEACSINEIAEKTLTHQSSVSVVVDKLVQKGLVIRKQDDLDRRRMLVRVTARGKALLKRAPVAPQEELSQGILSLTDLERKNLARGLARLLEVTGYNSGRPPMLYEEVKTVK